MIGITPERRSLLVMWNYTNPQLSEGAVLAGYRIYLDGQRVRELTSSSMNQFNITSLSPFTNYTVEVSAYNTRGDRVQQEGPRSDAVTITTLGGIIILILVTFVCPSRFCCPFVRGRSPEAIQPEQIVPFSL